MDTISGGIIPTGGSVNLSIEANKKGIVRLPDGNYLDTVDGVINETYTGDEGGITYFVDNTSNSVSLISSGLKGAIECTGDNPLYLAGNSALTSIVANGSRIVDANNCSLTAKAIGDLLYAAFVFNFMDCYFDFTGGSNALESEVTDSLLSVHNMAYSDVYTTLVTVNGGTILIDTV